MGYLKACKVALITGGSSGIGLALAVQLARHGHNVWLVARREDLLVSAVLAMQAVQLNSSQQFGYTCADVADPLQVQAAIDAVTHRLGLPDLVINCAGFAQPGYFQDLELRQFHEVMNVNYFGTVNVIRALVAGMIQRGSGYIVNISSELGFLGLFGYTAYSASKFAVAGFSDALRSEMKVHGIQVSIVYPPDVDTPQLQYETQYQPPEVRALEPLRTVNSPESVARSILRGIDRGQYQILPGLDNRLLYRLTRMLGSATYPIEDLVLSFMWKRAQKQNRK